MGPPYRVSTCVFILLWSGTCHHNIEILYSNTNVIVKNRQPTLLSVYKGFEPKYPVLQYWNIFAKLHLYNSNLGVSSMSSTHL